MWLLISAFRQYAQAEINARNGDWLKDFPLAHDPEGKVLGIVGMGGIGTVRCYSLLLWLKTHRLALY